MFQVYDTCNVHVKLHFELSLLLNIGSIYEADVWPRSIMLYCKRDK